MRTITITMWIDVTEQALAEIATACATRMTMQKLGFGYARPEHVPFPFMVRADGSITRDAWSHEGDRLITVGTWEAK